MPDPNFFILYVDNATESATLYTRLLGHPPLEASPGFAMFALDTGARLGLWARASVRPSATAAGGSELAFAVQGKATVDDLHRRWQAEHLQIVQPPTALDFGYTFVALDPDGHRLRVFAPA